MQTRRGFRLFELLLVITVVGVVVLVGISRYLDLGRETRRMGFELLAHNFTTAAANAHVHWLIQRSGGGARDHIEHETTRIYMSATGWPVSALALVNAGGNLTASDCFSLWQALLQNPPQASLDGESPRGQRRYHVSVIEPRTCRYELVTRELNSHSFHYFPDSGQVLIHVPTHKKISEL